MKYDYAFKINCVELYRSGQWAKTPAGIKQHNFRKMIAIWAKIAQLHGFGALNPPSTPIIRTAEEKYVLVARVLAGESRKSVGISAGISFGLLSKWVKCYTIYGYDGLKKKRGRPYKERPMKKDDLSLQLSPSEREELIRLRIETEYLRAENEAIKKSIVLRREKEAARLKAKKQQSLKNLEKKVAN